MSNVVTAENQFHNKRYDDLAEKLAEVYINGGYEVLGKEVRRMVEDDRITVQELPNLRKRIRSNIEAAGYELVQDEGDEE